MTLGRIEFDTIGLFYGLVSTDRRMTSSALHSGSPIPAGLQAEHKSGGVATGSERIHNIGDDHLAVATHRDPVQGMESITCEILTFLLNETILNTRYYIMYCDGITSYLTTFCFRFRIPNYYLGKILLHCI